MVPYLSSLFYVSDDDSQSIFDLDRSRSSQNHHCIEFYEKTCQHFRLKPLNSIKRQLLSKDLTLTHQILAQTHAKACAMALTVSAWSASLLGTTYGGGEEGNSPLPSPNKWRLWLLSMLKFK